MARVEIVGRDEIMGSDLLSQGLKRLLTLPVDVTEQVLRRTPRPTRSTFVGNRTEIVGADDALGDDFLATVAKGAKKVLTLPVDVTEWVLRHSPGPSDLLGEEEIALAREGGAVEREAARRRLSSSGYDGHWKFSRGDDSMGRSHRQGRAVRRMAHDPGKLARVQQRASSGDVRAQRLVQAYQSRHPQGTGQQYPQGQYPTGAQAPYASPWGTQSPPVPQTSYASAYVPPAPTQNVYYPASSSPSYDPGYYDDYSGAEPAFQKKQTEAFAALGAVVKPALKSKKISRSDLARAAAISAGPGASNDRVNAAKAKIADFLRAHGVKVEG